MALKQYFLMITVFEHQILIKTEFGLGWSLEFGNFGGHMKLLLNSQFKMSENQR